MKNKFFWLVFSLIVVGFLLRIWGIAWGNGVTIIPNEWDTYANSLRFWEENFIPVDFGYPSLNYYLAFVFQYLIFILMKVSGFIKDSYQFIELLKSNFKFLLITTRIPTAIYGTISIPLTYLIGKKIFNKKVGFFAALFLTFSFLHTANSHWAFPDILNTLVLEVALLFGFLFYKKFNLINAILFGFFAGFSISAKYHFPVLIIGLTAILLNFRKDEKLFVYLKKAILYGFVIIFFSILGFFLGCPYCVIQFPRMIETFSGARYYFTGWMGWHPEDVYFRFIKDEVEGIGLIVFLFSFFSLIFFKKYWKEMILLLSFPLVFYVITSFSHNYSERYIMVTFPSLLILASKFLVMDLKKLFPEKIRPFVKNKIFLLILSALILFPSIKKIYFADRMLSEFPDSYELASIYLNENIQKGSNLALDLLVPSFKSEDYRVVMRDPFVETDLPFLLSIKADYLFFCRTSFYWRNPENLRYREGVKYFKEISKEFYPIKKCFLDDFGTIALNKHFEIWKKKKHSFERKNPIFFPLVEKIPFNMDNKYRICYGQNFYDKDFYTGISSESRPYIRYILSDSSEIYVILINGKDKKEIKIETRGERININLNPSERKIIKLSTKIDPAKMLIPLKIYSKGQGRIIVKLGLNPLLIGKMFYDERLYREAITYLKEKQVNFMESFEFHLLLFKCYINLGEKIGAKREELILDKIGKKYNIFHIDNLLTIKNNNTEKLLNEYEKATGVDLSFYNYILKKEIEREKLEIKDFDSSKIKYSSGKIYLPKGFYKSEILFSIPIEFRKNLLSRIELYRCLDENVIKRLEVNEEVINKKDYYLSFTFDFYIDRDGEYEIFANFSEPDKVKVKSFSFFPDLIRSLKSEFETFDNFKKLLQ